MAFHKQAGDFELMTGKSVTIRDLAQAAKVSIGTVSRALKGQPGLSDATRTAVLEVAQQLGYDVAKLRAAKPRRIVFLYHRHLFPLADNQFYSMVLQGAEDACRDVDASLSLLSVSPGDDVATGIRRHEADALIGMGYFDHDTVSAMRACELPMVLVDHFHPGARCINDDNLHGARAITQLLLDGGAQRPAMIIGPRAHHSVGLRAKGFRHALFEAGRLADPDLEVTMDESLQYEDSAREAMRQLLALPQRPDAVFAYNDTTALAAISVCEAAGLRVPQDLQVAGYDDIAAAARSQPGLTTVRVDKGALGRAAVLALMEGDTQPGDTLQPVALVVRESTHPPNTSTHTPTHSLTPDQRQKKPRTGR